MMNKTNHEFYVDDYFFKASIKKKNKNKNIPKVFYCQNFDFRLVSIVLVK